MRYKNRFLFILLIICLFSIASVCASDIEENQNDNLTIENQDIVIDDEDVLATADENSDDNLAQVEQDSPIGKENSQITIDAGSVYVGETAKINITVQDATGYVVVSVDDQTFNETLTNHQVRLDVSGLTYGSHNVAVFYSGDDNYLSNFKLETLHVKRIQTQITDISIGEVCYGEDAIITVSVPKAVEGDIIIRLNDALKTNITERINDGKAEFRVPNLSVGNYLVNVEYMGNDYYDVNDTESETFEVTKADPGLSLVSFEGTVYDNATVMISINEEINEETVNISVGGVMYYNCPIEYGTITLTTNVLNEITSYEIIIEYGGNNNFKSSRIESSGTPKKISTYGITVIPMNITVNDDEIIAVEVPDHVDDVVIWVDGRSYRNVSFTNNKATFNVTSLTEGLYTVTATVNDTEFDHRNFTNIFTVSKVDPSIDVHVINETLIHVGDTVKIIVSVPRDVAENVSIVFDGKQFSQKPVNGNATFYINALTTGDNILPAFYYGDNKYRNNVGNVQFTVYKVQSFVNVSTHTISINDTEEINFTLPNDASGNITVLVNNKKYTVAVSGGKGTLSISKLHNGNYSVNATYNGDGKYMSSQNNTEMFKVIINSDQMDIIDEMNNTLSIYLNENATGNVTVEIEGEYFNATVINGTAKVSLKGAAMGTHHAVVMYSDTITHETLESVVDIYVPKYATLLDVDSSLIKIGETAFINVTTPKSATGNVTIEIEGRSYTEAIENGTAKFELTLLSAGNATLFVRYGGDGSFQENSTSVMLTAFKRESQVSVDAKDINVGDIAQIEITAPSDISGTVIVNVNGDDYTTVITNGSGVVNVANLQSGTYEIVADYLENANYLPSIGTQNVTVSKIQTVTVSYDVISEYNGGKYLVATLKDINGKAVSGVGLSIGIDGGKYLITDAGGQAKLSISNIAPGAYNVAVTFAGNAKYVKSATTVKVTIKKATPKLSAAKKTFKRKVKIKKYTVTLKTNKNAALGGVNVVLKVKNMKITAKTNAAGKATFNIKKLSKKGKYTSTVSFAGNKFYNAVSKTVKIIVK